MWRAASSLELPVGAKTELGDALIQRVKAGDGERAVVPWGAWARKLFYGPINLVATAESGLCCRLSHPATRCAK